MENEKLIAQISQREDAGVDKVGTLSTKTSTVISRMQRADELRKKTIRVINLGKMRLTKLKIQDSLEIIKKIFFIEYGENMELYLKTNEIEIYSLWVDGVTLAENMEKELPYKPEEIIRFRNRLRLWVRIFENLSYYHAKGILHGNIKPENILIKDRSAVDLKQSYDSEFFDKKEEVPHISLLDGGYAHFLPYQSHNLEEKSSQANEIINRNYWLPPEARGILDGCYQENSDIYSLAAIMAYDLGMISIEKSSALNALWPLYIISDSNVFNFGKKWYKWNTRHPVTDVMKRLKVILSKAVNPAPEKRTIGSREFAYEVMLLANRLAESTEHQNLNNFFNEFIPEFDENSDKNILNKQFDIPENLVQFCIDKARNHNNRFWIDARNKTANKYIFMRNLNTGMNVIQKNTIYYGVKFSPINIPFSSLDEFCNCLLNNTLFYNPLFLQELRTLFYNLGSEIDSVFYVLPSLIKYGDNKSSHNKNMKNLLIQVRHECLHNNIDKIFEKILGSSKLSMIIIDDINRADNSSLAVLLRLLKKQTKNIKWVIGVRSEEEINDIDNKKELNSLKHQDPTYSTLKDDRTRSFWVTKLNNLTSQQARFLATWSMVDLQISTEIIELLSSKVILMQDIFSNNYHHGKVDTFPEGPEPEDLIKEDKKVEEVRPLTEEEEEELEKKKDPLHLAYDALKTAIKIGLVSENRDALTGHLQCYFWEHQYIWLSLSLLLSKKTKSEIYYILSEYLCNNIHDKTTLFDIIHISEYLSKSDLSKSAFGAYSSLLVASEELFDINSAEFVISKLQMLGESVEKDRPDDASVLVPKIREHIADLSKSLGDIEQAEKYYRAVGWNLMNSKRKSILSMKNFFPSQYKNKEKRTEEFLKIIQQSEKAELFSDIPHSINFTYKSAIEFELYKIQKKLSDPQAFYDAEESKNIKLLFKSFIKIENSEESKTEKLPLSPRSKPIRGIVLSQLLRSCVGWIDNNILFPQVMRALQFTIENNDGEDTIHLLFSLILCAERNISTKTRSFILETITDLSGRIGNDMALYEVLLMRAWCSFFYEGDLHESKKNLDRINSSSGELPLSLRQCAHKLYLLVEFEKLPIDQILNHKTNIQKYIKKMQDFELVDWDIGYTILFLKQVHPSLKKVPGDEMFIGNILAEKTDQLLLYTHYLFEGGHAQSASMVTQEAKEKQIRQWFNTSMHMEYAPESFALKVIEYTALLRSSQSQSIKIRKRKNFFISLTKAFLRKKETFTKYWGEDRAIKENIKIDKSSTQDTERLHFLSQNLLRAGFHWSSHRLANKARTDLNIISNEIINLDSEERKEKLTFSPTAQVTHIRSERIEQYDISQAYPEQGVAINYILEFLHNFQNNVRTAELSESELKHISDFIKKSVPTETDLIESTLGAALKASAKRIHLKEHTEDNVDHTNVNSERNEDVENPLQNQDNPLKRVG
ncbi:protein kinase domain-containing protein [Fluviispira multicolorata]|uniref:Protein kinase domain-containing protein n=1 Tax=Fluviispira multicolorata TaxID=2654512 RepID=A0A833N752_9BACT|nr:serine/threonine-protein kinase [Fluviispira multicolorata]KAB8031825.1 hypothetical protein GCL57_04060 [Fluviispira multicolorata]